jgi:hypothetical protein
MDARQALTFVKKHGVVLMAARGPVPSLAEAIAGAPFRGSWWGHPQGRHMYSVFQTVCDSPDVLVCRLVGGKVTFVHKRLWPALVRLADRLPKRGLAATRDEHTASGAHRTVITRYPDWVPKPVLKSAARLGEDEAIALLGDGLFGEISR